MTPKLTCTSCGTLNAPTRRTCELCEQPLTRARVNQRDAQELGDPKVLAIIALISTLVIFFGLVGVLYLLLSTSLDELFGIRLRFGALMIPYTLYWVIGLPLANKLNQRAERAITHIDAGGSHWQQSAELWENISGFFLAPIIFTRGLWDAFAQSLREQQKNQDED